MNFIKNFILLLIMMVGLQLQNISAAEYKEEAPNYSDQRVYLDPALNFEENYSQLADGCKLFLGKPLQDYMVEKLTKITETTEKKKHPDEVPFKYKYLNPTISNAENEIEKAQIAYLIDAVKAGKNSAALANERQYQYLQASSFVDDLLENPQLPLLESIENGNDILVNLLIIHNPNFSVIDWNKKFPVLAEGSEIFNLQNPQEIIQHSLSDIENMMLEGAMYNLVMFEGLRAAVFNIEKQILTALNSVYMPVISDVLYGGTAINRPLRYVMQYKDTRFINKVYNNYIQHIEDKFREAIIYVIEHQSINEIKRFIKMRTDLNYFSTDIPTQKLFQAVAFDQPEIVELLLEVGVNPDSKDKSGRAPLFLAVVRGQIEIIHMLLSAGANPNITSDDVGITPLFNAASFNKTEIVQLLLNAGADPNMKNSHVQTQPSSAAENHNSTIDLQLSSTTKDNHDCDNKIPLLVAIENLYPKIVKLLLDANADMYIKIPITPHKDGIIGLLIAANDDLQSNPDETIFDIAQKQTRYNNLSHDKLLKAQEIADMMTEYQITKLSSSNLDTL